MTLCHVSVLPVEGLPACLAWLVGVVSAIPTVHLPHQLTLMLAGPQETVMASPSIHLSAICPPLPALAQLEEVNTAVLTARWVVVPALAHPDCLALVHPACLALIFLFPSHMLAPAGVVLLRIPIHQLHIVLLLLPFSKISMIGLLP